ncbi:MAG: DegT/DnrJ/EryC1/StrS family aminotransferase [Candidatus Harrisonbacteria bacterium]|nr:DegT/DnrJ/EryC1/StrS family aminotransferase [Candidatus Harrisonbacteria bacterium]
MKKLALFGGTPVLKKPFPAVYNIGKEELRAATQVLKRGPLSDFVGAKGDYFLGGKQVKKLEALFCKKFGVAHAVSFNSATTALHAAVVALGIGPGDEVIVSPYSMCASATAILMNGAVPVFADIDERTFCIDPVSVRKCITPRTKAIMAVNIFGGSSDFDALLRIAKEFNIKIIEDNAQSPGATYKGKYTGTIGDIGVFSFNVHKTIQSGEGGVLVTNNAHYAFRAQLARNHGEAYVDQDPNYADGPIIGSNYRMTELEAAIAYEQLRKLDFLNKKRLELVHYLTKQLAGIPGLMLPHVVKGLRHVFYVYPIKIDASKLGISRDNFARAMTAEGFQMSLGYTKPLYLLRVFQEQKAFNNTSFPFVGSHYAGKVNYAKGICPVVERMHEKVFTFTTVCQYPRTKKHIDLFVRAVKKVCTNRSEFE